MLTISSLSIMTGMALTVGGWDLKRIGPRRRGSGAADAQLAQLALS